MNMIIETARNEIQVASKQNPDLINQNLKRENEILKLELNALENKWEREGHTSFRSNRRDSSIPSD